MSVEEYARNTEALVAKLGLEGPSEMDKIQRFKAGIHPDMKVKVATRLDGSRWTNFAGVWSAMKQSVTPPAESGVPRTFGNGNGKKRKQHERSESGEAASSKGNGAKKYKGKA
jgi:hypothetical protein